MTERLFGDRGWRRSAFEQVVDEPSGPTQTEAVTAFVAAGEALLHAEAEALQRKWWWSGRRKAAVADAHQSADSLFRQAHEGISGAYVGSIPGRWGLLSSDIESTIERYLRGPVESELRDRLRAIKPRLFEARIQAHEGDRTLESELTRELVRCVDLEPDNVRARRLIHHLPSRERRIPDVDFVSVAERLDAGVHPPFNERYFHYRDVVNSLSRPRFPLATIWVSFWSMQELKLHDIVVEAGDTGRRRERRKRPIGLGTAVLSHLCRSADRHGLAIFGEIMPGDRTEESSARLARWYERHGFVITQKSPGVYLWAKIRREPKPLDS